MVATAEQQYVSVPQAGKMLGLGATAMHDLLDRGKIPYTQPNKQRRVLVADVIRYREKQTFGGGRKLARLDDDPLAG